LVPSWSSMPCSESALVFLLATDEVAKEDDEGGWWESSAEAREDDDEEEACRVPSMVAPPFGCTENT
jgi:hypothetical protein